MAMAAVVSYVFALVIVSVVNISSGQDTDCDFFQSVQSGTTYYVYSPNYPNSYGRSKTCRWRATCPSGQICRLTCQSVKLPATNGCTGDRLLVSRTGDATLTASDKYCGTGTLDIRSVDNQISIGLVTTSTSTGGSFSCTLVSEIKSGGGGSGNSCECGWKKSTRIVGGQETGVNEFPMMAGLVDASMGYIYCGATIISQRYVVTAAHCLDFQKIANVGVLYGEHNHATNSETAATNLVKAENFIIHNNFNRNRGFDYDIGLVRTAAVIRFSQLVGPACLPYKYRNYAFDGQSVQVLGWGSVSLSGADSDYLQKATLKVVPLSTCKSQIPNMLTDRQMCTYERGKDACQNDSGGPLVWQDSNGIVYHVGIISFGQACATSTPGVNTRTTMFLDWIESNTQGETFCVKA